MFDHTQVAMKKLSAQVKTKIRELVENKESVETHFFQVEDLKEQLGARADSEYALQEENRRLQVKKSEIKAKNLKFESLGGGDEREL